MTIGTDLTSVSTQGWYTEPTLTDNLTPVSTFGWYYTDAVNIVSVILSLPIETVERLTHQVRDIRAGYQQTLDVLAESKLQMILTTSKYLSTT